MIVKVNSHRARQKLTSLLGECPKGYFSFNKPGEWLEVPDNPEILKIKGITKSKLPEGAMQYISWS